MKEKSTRGTFLPGAALEVRCMEAALAAMQNRFAGIRSTFCDKYRQ